MTLSYINIATIIIATLALWVSIGRLWAAIHPILVERRANKILTDKLSRGPYDVQTIRRSTQYYVRPKCANIDPAKKVELTHALDAIREDLFSIIDKFLSDENDKKHHLFLLADSGTGKTSFLLNYYAYNLNKSKKIRHVIALVPLGLKAADEYILNIQNKENTVLFLDALDEDTKAIRNYKDRLYDLMEKCQSYKRVIITCRTQFFSSDKEIPVDTGVTRLGPRKVSEKATYDFWRLYLAPFDDQQIKEYLHRRFGFWQNSFRKRAFSLVRKVPLLSVRPMLLDHIPEIAASDTEIKYSYELYRIMVNAWIERESSWTDKHQLRIYSSRLAVDLYINAEKRGSESIPIDNLPILAKRWNIELQKWQLSGRSLLNRDSENNFKFAHRSIMEYLFSSLIIKGYEPCLGIAITDQMKIFLFDMVSIRFPLLFELKSILMENMLIINNLTNSENRLFSTMLTPEVVQEVRNIHSDSITKQKYQKKYLFAQLINDKLLVKALSHDKSNVLLSYEYDMKVTSHEMIADSIKTTFGARIGEAITNKLINKMTTQEKLIFTLSGKQVLIEPYLNFADKYGIDIFNKVYDLNCDKRITLEPQPPHFNVFHLSLNKDNRY
jgi:hypothetical protein